MVRKPRLIGIVIGDLQRQPSAQVKYGLFFRALAQEFPLVQVVDANLYGLPRLFNALQVFNRDLSTWKKRFYHNIPAFQARSQRVAAHLQKISSQADLILQVGVLYDACWEPILPSVIYTDYTAQLSAQRPDAGRSPFTTTQRQAWIGLEKQALQRAIHVCTRAEFVRQSILQDYGLLPEKVTTIGGGLNLPQMPELHPRNPDQPPTALFIGADFFRKGGDTLLDAFRQVQQTLPNAHLLMLTRGPQPADLPPNVEWIAPTWNRSEIEALYRRADVFVLPSRLETWGDVLLEAMAFGLPCIGVHGGPMGEIIQEGVTGLLVPPTNPAELAGAMQFLLTNDSIRLTWGKTARQRVVESFTWEKIIDRLVPIIRASANSTLISNLKGVAS